MFDRGIVGDSISHILDVFTYLTDADLRAIEIHEGLIDRVKEVLNTICSMKVAKASVQYPVAQLRILVVGIESFLN